MRNGAWSLEGSIGPCSNSTEETQEWAGISDTPQDPAGCSALGAEQWDPVVTESWEQSGEQGGEVREQPKQERTPLLPIYLKMCVSEAQA